MKTRFFIFLAAIAMGLAVLVPPSLAAGKKGDEVSMEKLKAQAKADYLEWEARTEAFLAKGKASAKEQYKLFLADLERAKAEARQSYEEAKDSTGEAWEKAKAKYDQAMTKLKAAYQAAEAELKK